jgi:hypothetical protein
MTIPKVWYPAILSEANNELQVKGPLSTQPAVAVSKAPVGEFQLRITLWDATASDLEPAPPAAADSAHWALLKAYIATLDPGDVNFSVEITCIEGP